MLRMMFPIFCGCVLALVVGTGASAAGERDPAAAASSSSSSSVAEEPGARSCFYACDTWTLYPTLDACVANCPDPCERVCF